MEGGDHVTHEENLDLLALSDEALRLVIADLERRRPGAPVISTGIRPRRRAWSYREIRRLEAAKREIARRGQEPVV
jgi:hypothetical protein